MIDQVYDHIIILKQWYGGDLPIRRASDLMNCATAPSTTTFPLCFSPTDEGSLRDDPSGSQRTLLICKADLSDVSGNVMRGCVGYVYSLLVAISVGKWGYCNGLELLWRGEMSAIWTAVVFAAQRAHSVGFALNP